MQPYLTFGPSFLFPFFYQQLFKDISHHAGGDDRLIEVQDQDKDIFNRFRDKLRLNVINRRAHVGYCVSAVASILFL